MSEESHSGRGHIRKHGPAIDHMRGPWVNGGTEARLHLHHERWTNIQSSNPAGSSAWELLICEDMGKYTKSFLPC